MSSNAETQRLARHAAGSMLPCILLQMAGQDATGKPFLDSVETRATLRHGLVVVSHRNLVPGASVGLEYLDSSARGRVLAQLGLWDGLQLYAIEYEPGSPSLIESPLGYSFTSEENHLRLQCSVCSEQVDFDLTDIQLMVYRSTKVVMIWCEKCADETLWTIPSTLGEPELITGSEAYDQCSTPPPPPREKTINDRRYKRIEVKRVKACLQRPDVEDDVVEVLDISRGGIRFLSYVDYQPNATVTVAVPYMQDGQNMFTPAKVVRVQCRPTVDIPGDFGLEFGSRNNPPK